MTATPAATTDLRSILSWYTGRARARVERVLPAIAESERAGGWLPRTSSMARAALRDATVAKKFARANDRPMEEWRHRAVGLLVDVADQRGERRREAKDHGFELVHAMLQGRFEEAPKLARLADRLRTHVQSLDENVALATAARWAADFTPAARLFLRLDAGRPRPSYVIGEVSEAIRANAEVALGTSVQAVRPPDVTWKLTARLGPDGHVVQTWVGTVAWPTGCRHGAGQFGVGERSLRRCQACGRAVRDARSWVPLVLDGLDGPTSLWVGRDCARRLFDCRVTGDVAFDRSRSDGSDDPAPEVDSPDPDLTPTMRR